MRNFYFVLFLSWFMNFFVLPFLFYIYLHRFTAAYSPYDLDYISYHGTSRHYFNINIFNDGGSSDVPTTAEQLQALKDRSDVFTFTLTADNYQIPTGKTTYTSFKGR